MIVEIPSSAEIVVVSTARWCGFNGSGSMDGYATYTPTPSTGVNHTSNITKPTISSGSPLPTDISDATILTTPAAAALVAFIFACMLEM